MFVVNYDGTSQWLLLTDSIDSWLATESTCAVVIWVGALLLKHLLAFKKTAEKQLLRDCVVHGCSWEMV